MHGQARYRFLLRGDTLLLRLFLRGDTLLLRLFLRSDTLLLRLFLCGDTLLLLLLSILRLARLLCGLILRRFLGLGLGGSSLVRLFLCIAAIYLGFLGRGRSRFAARTATSAPDGRDAPIIGKVTGMRCVSRALLAQVRSQSIHGSDKAMICLK